MHAEWTPIDTFEKTGHTDKYIGVIYAQYVNRIIPDQEMVDTFIMFLMECDLFNASYEKWHARTDENKTWTQSKIFLERGG